MAEKRDLYAEVDDYIAGLFAPEDEALKAALQAMRNAGLPDIQVSPVQGKLLHMLAKLTEASAILEIGTLGGYSTIWLARALLPGGRLITLEKEPRFADLAQASIARAGLADRVSIRVGPALDALAQLEKEGAGPFDFVFIDADKPPYAEYFDWSLKLSRPGALIVADNVVRSGRVAEPGAAEDPAVAGVMRMNTAIASNPAVEAVILQTVGMKGHDGFAIARVKPHR